MQDQNGGEESEERDHRIVVDSKLWGLEETDVDAGEEACMDKEQDAGVVGAQKGGGDVWGVVHERVVGCAQEEGADHGEEVGCEDEPVEERRRWEVGANQGLERALAE